jgi:hypothetical protein
MATTGELRAIIQELHLVDVGNAESYLGEETLETLVEEETAVTVEELTSLVLVSDSAQLATCDLVHI